MIAAWLSLCGMVLAAGAVAPGPVPARVWQPLREALVHEAPQLEGASLEIVAPGWARLHLHGTEPLSDAAFDHLLTVLTPVLGYRNLYLDEVDPAGHSLRPQLDPAWLGRLGRAWHDDRPAKNAKRPPPAMGGVLAGLRIAVAAGHGMGYSAANGWQFQRAITERLREDLTTNEIVFHYLAPMLEAAGADVVQVREGSSYPTRVVVDNDTDAGAAYSETGSWADGSAVGHDGTYRYATCSAAGGSTARWTFSVDRPVQLPLFVWFVAGSNRATQAPFSIDDAVGTATVSIDQSRDSARWRYLGTFPFVPGLPGAVQLSNQGCTAGKVVIADAIRVGGGQGFADFGGGVSGVPRWQEDAATHAVEDEVPTSVTGGTNDVTVRPAEAMWDGVDLYLAVHTNAAGNPDSGTASFVYSATVPYPGFDPNRSTPVPPGTLAFQEALHSSLLDTYRTLYDPNWIDQGMWGADFGELRPITLAWQNDPSIVIPATLVELAFHDNPVDAYYLRDARFRHDSARALVRGVVQYERGADAVLPPLEPQPLQAQVTAAGITLSWQPADDVLDPTAVPTSYAVALSQDGRVFGPPQPTSDPSYTVQGLSTCDVVVARLTALNASGHSLPSRSLMARVGGGGPRVLWVDGTRRLERSALEGPDPPNTAARMAADLAAAHGGDLQLETARPAAVDSGAVSLGDYDAVIWTTGETSVVDSSLTPTEQAAITDYLAAGGALIISGAEIGYDLVQYGSSADQAFYGNSLHAQYVADSANTFAVAPDASAGWLAGLPAFSFDDGTGHSFRVGFPDVISPQGGAWAELSYDTGDVAAIAYRGTGQLFYAGFPLETIEDDAVRAELIDRLLSAMLGEAVGKASCGVPYGVGPGDDGGPLTDGGGTGDAAGGDAASPAPPPPSGSPGCHAGCCCAATASPGGGGSGLLLAGCRVGGWRRRRRWAGMRHLAP